MGKRRTKPRRPRARGDPYTVADVVKTGWSTTSFQQWPPVVMGPCVRRDDETMGLLATAVDLLAHQRDGFLIHACGIPGLDGGKVRLAGLVARAGAPAMGFQEVRGRGQRVGRVFEIAGAVSQNGFWHELRLADFAMHRAALVRRERAAIDQLQRRVKMLGEIFRAPAVIGERRDRRQHVLVAALAAEPGLHPPDREQRSWRHAIALLDRSEQRALRRLERAAT